MEKSLTGTLNKGKGEGAKKRREREKRKVDKQQLAN